MTEVISTMPVLPLTVGMRVQFEAVSPTTGLPVSGVKVSNAVLYATDTAGPDDAVGDSGPFMLVPGPTPVETPTGAAAGSTGGAAAYPGAH